MKSVVRLAIMSVLITLISAFCAPCRSADRWVCADKTCGMHVDTKSISYPSENHVRAWFRILFEPDNYILTLEEADCKNRAMIRRMLGIYLEGKAVSPKKVPNAEWEAVLPETPTEEHLNYLCGKLR